MRSLLPACLALGLPLVALVASAQPNTGPYPIDNGLAATVVGTPAEYKAELPENLNFEVRSLEPLVERPTPTTLRYARPLQYLRVIRDEPAPLAFVIAGTGASALSSKCVMLSSALYQAGYSVACLPSPTSVTFMLGAAQYPVPGRMRTDVDDLYRLMQAVRDDLDAKTRVTGYALTGWSLGATEAAFIARHDAEAGVFDFSRVLLLNPAVDVWASVQRMDRLLADNLEGGIDGIPAFVARGLGGLKQLYSSGDPIRFNEDFLYRAYRTQSPHRGDIAAIVGLAFRLSLANMAFAADVITHADVIVPENVDLGPYDSLDPYIKRSFEMSFDDYFERLLVPYWNRDGRDVSREQIIAEADLRGIADYLAGNTDIGVFTSEDDPILNADEIAFLRETFGKRARIRPHGGHMGNLASANTVAALQQFFSRGAP
ncbi:putative serine protein kinase PrkA [Salinisphaera sp. T5B8]|uniref:alpha/beta hydrolase n=1 Tax=Salinisphaera sp. T5B8 TaxID=1304154 RepID=UPI00333FECFF